MAERAFQYTGKDRYIEGVPFGGWMRTGDCYTSNAPLHDGDTDLLAEVDGLRTRLAAAQAERDSLARRCAVRFEENQAGHAVTLRLLNGWTPDGSRWWKNSGRTSNHITQAERDWLVRVAADTPKETG